MDNYFLEYAQRMARKPVASRDDIAIYRPEDSGAYALNLGDQTVRLASRLILGPPRAEDLMRTAENPPFWDHASNRPTLPAVVPEVVDHRPYQTRVKNQGERATCVSFAAMAQIEARIKKEENREVDLSEQYAHWLFMHVDGKDQCSEIVLATDAASFLERHGVCEEALFPYQDKDAVERECGAGPSAEAKGNARYGITDHATITAMGDHSIRNLAYVEALLCGGLDIVVGLEIALIRPADNAVFDAFLDINRRPVSIARTDGRPGNAPGHAMLLVGYDRTKEKSPQPLFIMKNRWGDRRGDHGYFYLTYDYFLTYAKVGYVITGVRSDMTANV